MKKIKFYIEKKDLDNYVLGVLQRSTLEKTYDNCEILPKSVSIDEAGGIELDCYIAVKSEDEDIQKGDYRYKLGLK